MTNINKEKFFEVDFIFINQKIDQIKPELFKDEISNIINSYSSGKKSLSLLNIIDLSNSLATVMNQLWSSKSKEESKKNCQEVIDYLSEIVNLELNK